MGGARIRPNGAAQMLAARWTIRLCPPFKGRHLAVWSAAHPTYGSQSQPLRPIEERMDATGETQVSLTDPDCRAMATTS
jgi:hypothetical protein